MKRFHAILCAAALAAACGSDNNNKPTVVSFGALPGTVGPGGSATLTWNVTGASTVTIDNGIGAQTGTAGQVSPAQTTTYTLTATNGAGTVTAQTAVTVDVNAAGAMAAFRITPSQ